MLDQSIHFMNERSKEKSKEKRIEKKGSKKEDLLNMCQTGKLK